MPIPAQIFASQYYPQFANNANVGTLSDIVMVDNASQADRAIVDMLSSSNMLIPDMMWVPSNERNSHQTLEVIGLPVAMFRDVYQGVLPSKGNFSLVTEKLAQITSQLQLDSDVIRLDRNGLMVQQQISMHTAALGLKLIEAVLYCSPKDEPRGIMGLSERYNTTDVSIAPAAYNTIDCGGAADSPNLTSMWIISHGPNAFCGVYQNDMPAGIFIDRGPQFESIRDPAGNAYPGQMMTFKWNVGISLADWRTCVRLCNIDTERLAYTKAVLGPNDALQTGINLVPFLNTAINSLPATVPNVSGITTLTNDVGRPRFSPPSVAIYANRTILAALSLQASRQLGMAYSYDHWDGRPTEFYRGIPVRCIDKLKIGESYVGGAS